MSDVMFAFVGEQPIPNLLPIRYDQPSEVVLAYTESTREVSKRLEQVLHGSPQVHLSEVPPFEILVIRQTLEKLIIGRGWKASQIVFNLTGGTKAMALAGYGLAEELGSRFLYVQSEEVESRVYRYRFENGLALFEHEETIPGVITLDNYLKVHLGIYYCKSFSQTEGGKFEEIIYQILQPVVDEILSGIQHGGALDIDLVLRRANQVGIAEVKTGRTGRTSEGIKQLNTAGRREFLGIYAKKLLIVDMAWDHTLSGLKDLAEASEIKVIELPSYDKKTGKLSNQDEERLVREVRETFRS